MILTLGRIAGSLVAAAVISFLYNLYQQRMLVRRLKTQHGIDILPHSFLFGHLLEIDRVMRKFKFPPGAHTHWLPLLFMRDDPSLEAKGLLYLDVWPISEPLLAVWDLDMLTQISDANFPKAQLMRIEMGPVTGARDLLTLEGAEWKRARAMFNPGFSVKNLLLLIPEFVDEIKPFQDRLRQAASTKETIKLENLTISLAIDIIGRAVLGASLNSQTSTSPIVSTIMSQIPLLYNSLDLKKALNPVRYFKLWLYRRQFRKLLLPYVESAAQDTDEASLKSKTVLRLALKEHLGKQSNLGSLTDFIERTVGHVWIFLFAGHDTTAITMAFAFYLLSKYPEKAALLRAEHDHVLGTNLANAAEQFKENPALVNQMPYTTAVMKETLRLWAPVTGGVRSSSPGHFLVHPQTGQKFPTHGWMINNAGAILHRLEEYWPRPNDFIPERWLTTDSQDPLHPRKGTFRPFETGARNCIGQELVSIEIRLLLALIVREFDFVPQFPEDGPTFLGEKAYSVEVSENVATAHAKDRMPVSVILRPKFLV